MNRATYVAALAPLLDEATACFQNSQMQNIAYLTPSQREDLAERDGYLYDLQSALQRAYRCALRIPETNEANHG